ncbi:MAG: sarcosine oxidase subunit delta [Acidimicrobiia bacterium]|nr:sarcosine oxidase subunit delta [Acidimicrobiia bacterium]
MSIRITCPHCGERTLEEYVYGEMHDNVPVDRADEAAWEVDRSFMHNNIEGVVREAWFHLYGCRRWVVVQRNTTTDEILEVE